MEIGAIGSNTYAAIISSTAAANNVSDMEDKKNNEVNAFEDSVELSMSYSNNDIADIIDDIKLTMGTDSINNSVDTKTKNISEYASEYGRILKSIKSNKNINTDSADKLTKILNSAYDDYAKNISDKLAGKVTSFFNSAYNVQKNYEENGIDIGIKGEQLVNKDNLAENINSMMAAAKAFYNNNTDGTQEDLDKALDKNFSTTESVEKIGYRDFNSLQKAIDTSKNNYSLDADLWNSLPKIKESYNTALDALNKDNASSIVKDTYKKAAEMNYNAYRRGTAYEKISSAFDKDISNANMFVNYYEEKLKEFEKAKKEKISAENKKIAKMEEELKKASIQIRKDEKDNMVKQLDDMKQQNKKFIDDLNKTQKYYEDQLEGWKVTYMKTSNRYDKFKKDPSSTIDNYLADDDNGGNISTIASNTDLWIRSNRI